MKTTKVTPETYIRAESDRQFGVIAKMAGGVNRFYHFRRPTPAGQTECRTDEQGHALLDGHCGYLEGRHDHRP